MNETCQPLGDRQTERERERDRQRERGWGRARERPLTVVEFDSNRLQLAETASTVEASNIATNIVKWATWLWRMVAAWPQLGELAVDVLQTKDKAVLMSYNSLFISLCLTIWLTTFIRFMCSAFHKFSEPIVTFKKSDTLARGDAATAQQLREV